MPGPGTSQVSVFRGHMDDGTSVYFVDTPGFDNSHKTDIDVLKDVADYLNKSYENKILLSGIIYLHRISDTRVGGSGMRNLRMFRKLVGDDSLDNVVLATTMWSVVPDIEVGVRRESELTQGSEFWRHMISKGSRVFRQDRGVESAKEIVQHIIQKQKRHVLDIQQDMVDRGVTLNNTAAGKEVQAELAKQQAEHEQRIERMQNEWREAIANKDQEHQEELRQPKQEIDRQMLANQNAIQRLQVSKDEIRLAMEARWAQERQQLFNYDNGIELQRQQQHARDRAEMENANRARQAELESHARHAQQAQNKQRELEEQQRRRREREEQQQQRRERRERREQEERRRRRSRRHKSSRHERDYSAYSDDSDRS